jgi:hypothetical protein
MPIAHVGHSRDGLYSASVDYDADTPFGYVIGPVDVSVDEAVAWARERAQVVIVRTEEARYSAGEVAKGDLPEWPRADSAPDPRPAAEPQFFEVEGHLGSQAPDLEDVAARFADAIRRDERTSGARHWLREWGLAVAFTIRCPSEESYELGSNVLRDGWAAAGVPTGRVTPFDTASMSVRLVAPPG